MAVLTAQDGGQFAAAADFVAPREKFCCPLMQKILAQEQGVLLLCEGRDVRGVLYFCEGGVLLPCLPVRNADIARAAAAFFRGRRLFCLSGKASYVRFLHKVFALSPSRRIREMKRFIFMEHTQALAQPAGDSARAPQYRIRACTRADAEGLMPLHLGYVREETRGGQYRGRGATPFAGLEPKPAAERARLERILKEELVVAAEAGNGRLVAKAQTNAQSPRYVQLGGVYTLGAFRRQGLASALVARLAERAEREGRRAVLYVDSRNGSALHAYGRAGFSEAGEYMISYYWE